ncbi:F-box/kelch-repeat protein At1g80440-like [Curcuma longa]|uniref:F-box/kelch-repeat protein At1g80440-like n=1 Tax=Curcuma longa TaxID=136217 RepID=UPI003D9E08FC
MPWIQVRIPDVWTELPFIPDCSLCSQVPVPVAVGHELVVIGRHRLPTKVAVRERAQFVDRRLAAGVPIPGPRRAFFAFAAACSGVPMVFVAGGLDEKGQALRSALAYNVETDAWVQLPDMKHPRRKCRGIFVTGLFRVFGDHPRSEAFDTTAGRWTTRHMVIRRGTGMAAVEGRVYICNSRVGVHVYSRRDGRRKLALFGGGGVAEGGVAVADGGLWLRRVPVLLPSVTI